MNMRQHTKVATGSHSAFWQEVGRRLLQAKITVPAQELLYCILVLGGIYAACAVHQQPSRLDKGDSSLQ